MVTSVQAIQLSYEQRGRQVGRVNALATYPERVKFKDLHSNPTGPGLSDPTEIP